MNVLDVSIAIPTYHRTAVLTETVRSLLRQRRPASEIILVDQTPASEVGDDQELRSWDRAGCIRWLRQDRPSVPAAMNHALLEAKGSIVLFLDDDIVPSEGLVDAHAHNFTTPEVSAVAGQVLQPGEAPRAGWIPRKRNGIWTDLDFRFNSTDRCVIRNCMAGNFSVRREAALAVGGFDENFVSLAYRFETEFCRRLAGQGGRIVFDPAASIRHLQLDYGGMRCYGHHRWTCRPDHSVGEYYFALRHGVGLETVAFIAYRMFRAVRTRHNLLHPWWIPLRLVAEMRGLNWAMRLARNGPAYIDGPPGNHRSVGPSPGPNGRPDEPT